MDQELLAYLDRRFAAIDQRFQETSQRLEGQIESLRGEMNQRFQEHDRRFERLEEAVRHAHVLLESLRGDNRVVAEGLMGFSDQLERHTLEVDRKLGELNAAISPVYRNLEEKMDRQTVELKGRVVVLEQRADRETRDILTVIREKYGLREAL